MEYIKNENDTQEVKDLKELAKTLRYDIRNMNNEKHELSFKFKMLEQALNNTLEQLKTIKESKEVKNCEVCFNKSIIINNTNKELEELKLENIKLKEAFDKAEYKCKGQEREVESKIDIIKSLRADNDVYKETLLKRCETYKLYSEKLGYRSKKIRDIKTRLENLLKLIDLNEEPESEDLKLC